ncbi:MAG: Glyceraldehyde-3-phosphate dehydrogenase 2, partial [Parcubacteria group bacterium GW2011_GWF2_46_8]
MQKPLRIAINGFGRIGRLAFRLGFGDQDFEFVAINDLGDAANLVYLLKHDTVYRSYQKNVVLEIGNETVGKTTSTAKLVIEGRRILVFQEKDPLNLPWQDLEVDLVIESTGFFESYEKSEAHIKAGAKRVLISAPTKDEDGPNGKTVLLGINEDDLKTCSISSN